MLKKAGIVSLKNFCLISFVLMISVMFIPGIGTTPVQAAKATDVPKTVAAPVDINSATQKELETIKGVGPATAKKIIAGRPYKSVDELSRAGLSAKSIEAMKPLVTVGKGQAATAKTATAPSFPAKAGKNARPTAKSASAAAKLAPGTKININSADQATLEKLPEIGPVKAKAIIAGRPYKSIEDVMKVSGIKGKTFEAIKDYIVVK